MRPSLVEADGNHTEFRQGGIQLLPRCLAVRQRIIMRGAFVTKQRDPERVTSLCLLRQIGHFCVDP